MSRRLQNLVENCYCCLRPSPIHGIGVFALQPIPARVDPFAGLPHIPTTPLSIADIDKLPQAVLYELFRHYASYSIPRHGTLVAYLPAYLNNASYPNLRTCRDNTYRTMHRVEAGTELTIRYEQAFYKRR
jgi:hypothetical protein